MPNELKLLICEDDETDALLLLRQLQKDGYQLHSLQVDNAHDFTQALENSAWDLIISDYNIPGFGGPLALDIVNASGKDIPFILVSGAIGEEQAVNMVKAGANDYLMKGNLMRLGQVIERELKEVGMRREIRVADQQRRVNEEKYRAIINNAILGIFISPAQGNIIESNPAAQVLFGYTEQELLALKREQLFDTEGALLMNQLAMTGDAADAKAEFTGIRKDGSRFDCAVTIISFRDIHGELMKCSIVEDISKRKQALERIAESQRLLNQAETLAHMGSTEIDLVTEKREWSDEFYRLLGYEPGAIKPDINVFLELLPGEEKQRYLEWYNYVKQHNAEPEPIELKLIRKDGTERYVFAKGQISRQGTDHGHPKLVAVVQDITDLKRVMQELEMQNRQLKEIAWTQSHIVRAPLSRLMGLVKLLSDGVVGPGDDQAEIFSYILQSANELDQIIADITEKTCKINVRPKQSA
ncbi:MAG: PAS domain S-box protein [Bacteroidetes bacterium]|nr:PAS domain S-box protein [Bacteroidota bacterium]